MQKLLKNIVLVTLTGLFFIINTGFTLSLHYCNMQEETSFTGCGMCDEPDDADAVCSNEESASAEFSFSTIPHKCCESILGTVAGTDQYLLNQPESVVKSVQVDLISITNKDNESLVSLYSSIISDSSPPTKTVTKLFLSSHNFRI